VSVPKAERSAVVVVDAMAEAVATSAQTSRKTVSWPRPQHRRRPAAKSAVVVVNARNAVKVEVRVEAKAAASPVVIAPNAANVATTATGVARVKTANRVVLHPSRALPPTRRSSQRRLSTRCRAQKALKPEPANNAKAVVVAVAAAVVATVTTHVKPMASLPI
jgi:hypothetical protein